jgi:hypothetical protein
MTPLWLLPLAVGAIGALALGLANRKLARELDALRRAVGAVPNRPGSADPGGRPGTGAPGR